MVKSVLGEHHQGLREWVIQRVSAILIAIYIIAMMFYFVMKPNLSYAEWHYLFSRDWMKIATLLFIASLLFHAWVGMWTIFTDYVKPYVIRCLLNLFVFLMLVTCFLWGMLILWSV
ncbi:MAG: succinate dehydrogenase, hydrophobic membrane anchor protein [Gammaproteobacteria bacterium RIFCSPHIGHO2_12_FULL_37_34]|nr:MAG: succinate dehydrogenase, hydrophobic membrane anchor protein [Gammaproteobacteria bacterium RIFCSPHIGHO2_12_FULL_37_34]